MSSNQQETAGSRLLGLLCVAVVLYFTWKAEPLISYFNRPMFLDAMWRNADGALTLALAFLIDASDKTLLMLTITAPLGIFLGGSGKDGGGAFFGLCFLALGPLGWYVGREFTRAYGRYSACMDNSFLGFGCNVDGPVLLFVLFASLLLMCVAALVLDIIAGVAERMKGAA